MATRKVCPADCRYICPKGNKSSRCTGLRWGPRRTIFNERDGKQILERMRWGHVSSWWSKPLKELKLATFNARAETVATKPMFRLAFKRNRCLIPVSGYYEWQDTLGGKQPWYFTARDGSPALTIAGLWDNGRTWKPTSPSNPPP